MLIKDLYFVFLVWFVMFIIVGFSLDSKDKKIAALKAQLAEKTFTVTYEDDCYVHDSTARGEARRLSTDDLEALK